MGDMGDMDTGDRANWTEPTPRGSSAPNTSYKQSLWYQDGFRYLCDCFLSASHPVSQSLKNTQRLLILAVKIIIANCGWKISKFIGKVLKYFWDGGKGAGERLFISYFVEDKSRNGANKVGIDNVFEKTSHIEPANAFRTISFLASAQIQTQKY